LNKIAHPLLEFLQVRWDKTVFENRNDQRYVKAMEKIRPQFKQVELYSGRRNQL